jgi:sugar/nucleoside kinase (ribokinase family)
MIFSETIHRLFEKRASIFQVSKRSLPAIGCALITVDDKGENCIVVAPGANAALTVEDIR